jgi:hypothetical protein
MPHPSQESRHDQPFFSHVRAHSFKPIAPFSQQAVVTTFRLLRPISALPKFHIEAAPIPHPRSLTSRSPIITYHRVRMSPQTNSRHFVVTSSNTTPQIEVFYFLSRPSTCPVLACSCHSLRYVLTPSKLIDLKPLQHSRVMSVVMPICPVLAYKCRSRPLRP